MKHGKPYHECAFRIVNGYQYIYWAGDDLSTVRRVAAGLPDSFKILTLTGELVAR
jgi:hypothetical protein